MRDCRGDNPKPVKPKPSRKPAVKESMITNVLVIAIWFHAKRFAYGPSTIQTAPYRHSADSSESPPLGNRQCFAAMEQPCICAPVVDLFFVCCPPAIRWFVVSIVVDSFNRVLWGWLRSHVSKEVFKGTAPPIAHTNTTAAVMRIVLAIRVVATGLHTRPAPCFSAFRHSMRRISTAVATAFPARNELLESRATATPGLPAAKIFPKYIQRLPAVTNALPINAVLDALGVSGSCQRSESVASSVRDSINWRDIERHLVTPLVSGSRDTTSIAA